MAKEGFEVDLQQMDEFCKENGFAKWFETSAKENINIETSFEFLISEVKSLFSFGFNFRIVVFSKIMKHLNQLQEQTPVENLHGNTVNVTNKSDSKKRSGRKCYGGDSSSQ